VTHGRASSSSCSHSAIKSAACPARNKIYFINSRTPRTHPPTNCVAAAAPTPLAILPAIQSPPHNRPARARHHGFNDVCACRAPSATQNRSAPPAPPLPSRTGPVALFSVVVDRRAHRQWYRLPIATTACPRVLYRTIYYYIRLIRAFVV